MTRAGDHARLLPPLRLDSREVAGALGDLGTLLPLAVLLVTVNGLNPTVVFGLVALVYLVGGLYYRIPMAVQPMKSFAALAVAFGLGASAISAGGLLMGACLLALGLCGAADWLARRIPRALVRGVQLGVGVILIRVGARLAVQTVAGAGPWFSIALALGAGLLILVFRNSRRFPAGVLVVGGGILAGLALFGPPPFMPGPVLPRPHPLAPGDFWTALIVLVLPQLPLTLTNSLAATCDVARSYYGPRSSRVTGRAVAVGLGLANLAAGALGGMPVCHGSGGLTAHYRFGARTGGSVLFLGTVLLALALGFGPSMAGFCSLIPAPVLGALLVYVGAAHCLLILDVSGRWNWTVVLATGGVAGILNHNGYGLTAGVAVLAAQYVAHRWQTRSRRRPVEVTETVAAATTKPSRDPAS